MTRDWLSHADRDRTELSWRVEEACLNAFPAIRTVLVAGWLVRLSGGRARRANSINPLKSSSDNIQGILTEGAELYARAAQPLIFRAPSIASGLDRALDAAGFSQPEAETCTLLGEIQGRRVTVKTNARLEPSPTAEWLAASKRMNAFDRETLSVYRAMLGLIASPVRYAAIHADGRIVSIAYGAICRGLLVIESVATSPAYRGQSLAYDAVATLMTWAQTCGVSGACLQVLSENLAARRLYEKLGFKQELYRYHYRRAAPHTTAPIN